MNNYYTPNFSVINGDCFPINRDTIFKYMQRILFQKALSRYKWILPESWDIGYFKYTLYNYGFINIFRTGTYGVIAQRGGVEGFNLYEEPRFIYTSNSFVTARRTIGIDGMLFRFSEDWFCPVESVNYYATLLSEIVIDIYINLFNSKVSYIIESSNRKDAEKSKKLFNKITEGEAVVFEKKSSDDNEINLLNRDVKQSFIVTDLVDAYNSVMNMFNTDFGIPNSNTDKRERLIKDEVNSNNFETESRARMFYDYMKTEIDQTINLFPELSGKFSLEWKGETNATRNNNSVGNVQME